MTASQLILLAFSRPGSIAAGRNAVCQQAHRGCLWRPSWHCRISSARLGIRWHHRQAARMALRARNSRKASFFLVHRRRAINGARPHDINRARAHRFYYVKCSKKHKAEKRAAPSMSGSTSIKCLRRAQIFTRSYRHVIVAVNIVPHQGGIC